MPGKPPLPAADATLTMCPDPRGRIRCTASWVPTMTACRLMSICRAIDARVLVLEVGHGHDPGVVDQDVDRPELVLDLVEERREGGVVGDVECASGRLAPELGCHRSGEVAVEVADRQGGSLSCERAGRRGADAAGGAGDHDDFAGQVAGSAGHGRLFSL